MKKAEKLAGILALTVLCACASNRGDTRASSTPDVATRPTQGTMGTTAGTGDTNRAGATMGETGTGTTGTTAGTSTESNGSSAKKVDCSTVRCAACPTGQHPALTPPDCCRCIPG
jgi:hypothetical protein